MTETKISGMTLVYVLLAAWGCLLFASGCSQPYTDVPSLSAAQQAAQDAKNDKPTCAAALTEPYAINGTQFFDSGSFDDGGGDDSSLA